MQWIKRPKKDFFYFKLMELSFFVDVFYVMKNLFNYLHSAAAEKI